MKTSDFRAGLRECAAAPRPEAGPRGTGASGPRPRADAGRPLDPLGGGVALLVRIGVEVVARTRRPGRSRLGAGSSCRARTRRPASRRDRRDSDRGAPARPAQPRRAGSGHAGARWGQMGSRSPQDRVQLAADPGSRTRGGCSHLGSGPRSTGVSRRADATRHRERVVRTSSLDPFQSPCWLEARTTTLGGRGAAEGRARKGGGMFPHRRPEGEIERVGLSLVGVIRASRRHPSRQRRTSRGCS